MSQLTDRVDAVFAKWNKPDSPGCVLAVIKDGGFIYTRGYGMADLERGVPITADSIFDIGSTGKQFTATVIAILANQGLLSIDDPIRKYLPEMPAYAEQITIRQLLHHTSGLRDYLTLMELRGMSMENIYAEDLLLDLITRQKGLNFKPGSEYLYSNSGYFLLGTIAQRVTRKHITELIREHILHPLGMRQTTFNKDYRPLVKMRAMSYDAGEKEGTFVNALALSGGFGDGAVLTNVGDLLLWDRNFYDNKLNNAQPDLIEQLLQTGKLNNGKSIKYASGLVVDKYNGQIIVKHGGGWAGYRTEMMRFPDHKFTIICIGNLGNLDPTMLCQQAADIYLEDVFAPHKPKLKRASNTSAAQVETDEFTGIYQGRQSTVEISIKDNMAYLFNGVRDRPMRPLGKKKFQLEGHPIFLSFTGKQNERLSIDEDGETVTKFKRVRNERFIPSSLAIYAGKYFSSELDICINLTVEDNTLQLIRTPFDDPKSLHPFTEDTFLYEAGEIRFHSKNGSPKGFILNAGRVTNIRFRKVS